MASKAIVDLPAYFERIRYGGPTTRAISVTGGVTFDGMTWAINDGAALGNLANVTITNVSTEAIQLSITRATGSVNIVNPVFMELEGGNGGKYLSLVDSDVIKGAVPHVKVRYRKFKDAFETSLQGLSLTGLEMLTEDFQDA